MKHEKRSKWSSQATFILAAIGSAVGLGNAWRFPGLAAKHGGGTYLLIYLVALFVVGIPLLMMEVSVARKFHRGAGESMRGINKKTEFIGWAATSNAFVISTYYAVVFAWVILNDGMLGKICRYDRRCKCGAESFCRSNTDNMGYQRF